MEDSKRPFYKSPVLYSSIFAFIVCSLGYYFISYKPNHDAKLGKNKAAVAVITETSNDTDSDHDGLPDWKEVVYGSDPNKKDTDGDGILDGAEVSTGHDPTKVGPNDLLHNLSLGSSSTSTPDDPEKTFAREFISKEIENTGSAIVTNMIRGFDSSQIKPRYGLRDLNVISDNSPEQMRKYANDFGIILNKYQANKTEDEALIISKAIKSKRESDIQKIELPAIEYRNSAEELRKLPVPSNLAEHHLNIVSGYDTISRSLFATEKLLSNPVEGSAGWQMYLSQRVTVMRGYAGAINVLHNKGIIFDRNEPGYYFAWQNTKDTTKQTQPKTSTTIKK